MTNPIIPAKLPNQIQGPEAPPPVPPGFLGYASQPMNQEKIAGAMSATPGQPMPGPLGSLGNTPLPQATPSTPPPQPLNIPQLAGPTNSVRPVNQAEDQANNPSLYGAPMLKNGQGSTMQKIAAGLLGFSGGLRGNPNLGLDYANSLRQHDADLTKQNNDIYNQRFVQPQTDARNAAAQTAETNYKVAQTNALNTPKPEKPENVQQLYSDAIADAMSRGVDPNKDPKVMQLQDAVTGVQRTPAPKEPSRDDRAIAIYSKPPAQRTPEENSYIAGYEKYIKESKTDPGVARSSVFLQMPTAVADPNNPGGVIYTTRAGAIGQKAPTDIGTTIPKNVLKSATSGDIGKNLNAFNTASEHLKTLSTMTDALNNGDVQALNRIGNEYSKQIGSPAPTNFQAVKSAVAGEVSKTFKGGQATDAEIKEFNDAVSAAGSPAQLKGVIDTYQVLMNSKRQALQDQVTQGMKGQPNFGDVKPLNIPQQFSVGQTVTLKNGKSAKITAVHPDGSFDVE